MAPAFAGAARRSLRLFPSIPGPALIVHFEGCRGSPYSVRGFQGTSCPKGSFPAPPPAQRTPGCGHGRCSHLDPLQRDRGGKARAVGGLPARGTKISRVDPHAPRVVRDNTTAEAPVSKIIGSVTPLTAVSTRKLPPNERAICTFPVSGLTIATPAATGPSAAARCRKDRRAAHSRQKHRPNRDPPRQNRQRSRQPVPPPHQRAGDQREDDDKRDRPRRLVLRQPENGPEITH